MTTRTLSLKFVKLNGDPVPNVPWTINVVDERGRKTSDESVIGSITTIEVSGVADENGEATAELNPNELGTQNTLYMIRAEDPETGAMILRRPGLDAKLFVMPDADTSLQQIAGPPFPDEDAITAAAVSAFYAELWATHDPAQPVPAPPGDGDLLSSRGYAVLAGGFAQDAAGARDTILQDAGFIAIATDLLGDNTIGTVAAIAPQVSTVAGIDDEVVAVAGIAANVTSVAGIVSDVTAVAGVAQHVPTVAGIAAEVSTVAGIQAAVTTTAGISDEITLVAGIAADVTVAAENITAIQEAPAAAQSASESATIAEQEADRAENALNHGPITVTVGPDVEDDYETLNDAIEALSKRYPSYEADGITVEIVLQDDFVMAEQVLVNDRDLGWIRITNESAGATADITAISEGEILVAGVAQVIDAEVADYGGDAADLNSTSLRVMDGDGEWHYFWFNAEQAQVAEITVSDFGAALDGQYVRLQDPDSGATHYFWFNSDDEPDPEAGDTGHEIDTSALADADAVAGALQSAIDAVAAFSASVDDNVVTVTNADPGAATATASGEDVAVEITASGGQSDPGHDGTGHEVELAIADTPAQAAGKLQTVIDGVTEFGATVDGREVTITNADAGAANAPIAAGEISASVDTAGVTQVHQVKITAAGHGLSDGDLAAIRDHVGTLEEVDYVGLFEVTEVSGDDFELDGIEYEADRAGSGDTGTVRSIVPVPVSREALTQQWEFFYYPAFGCRNGKLPIIDCLFEMDESGDPETITGTVYQSYLDGLCATDHGEIQVEPFGGFINAHGSNFYGTRTSRLNGNDGIFDRGGRHGIWAYSGTIINARRAFANDCGWVARALELERIDEIDELTGCGILATRGSTINADAARASGNYADNVHAEHGATISAPDIEAFGSEVGDDKSTRYGSKITRGLGFPTIISGTRTVMDEERTRFYETVLRPVHRDIPPPARLFWANPYTGGELEATIDSPGPQWVYNSRGLLVPVHPNSARLDFDPATGAFRGALSEPARENLNAHSWRVSEWAATPANATPSSEDGFSVLTEGATATDSVHAFNTGTLFTQENAEAVRSWIIEDIDARYVTVGARPVGVIEDEVAIIDLQEGVLLSKNDAEGALNDLVVKKRGPGKVYVEAWASPQSSGSRRRTGVGFASPDGLTYKYASGAGGRQFKLWHAGLERVPSRFASSPIVTDGSPVIRPASAILLPQLPNRERGCIIWQGVMEFDPAASGTTPNQVRRLPFGSQDARHSIIVSGESSLRAQNTVNSGNAGLTHSQGASVLNTLVRVVYFWDTKKGANGSVGLSFHGESHVFSPTNASLAVIAPPDNPIQVGRADANREGRSWTDWVCILPSVPDIDHLNLLTGEVAP